MSTHRFAYPTLAIVVFLVGEFSAAQTTAAGEPSDLPVKWETRCSDKGCLLMTDVLRGYSGISTPDPKDTNEYIGIYVAVDRVTRKPAYFAFHVDPNSAPDQGVFITFTKTVKKGGEWHMEIDSSSTSRLPFSSCGKDSCVSRIREGLVEDGRESRKMDLLEKFLSSDAVLVLYVKQGRAYRTMILLSSFKKEYERVLATDLSSAITR